MLLRNKTDRGLPNGDDFRPPSDFHRAHIEEKAALPNAAAVRDLLPLPLSGIILCGGKSSRMGRQKAFLPYAGCTLIEHRLRHMQGLFAEVFLVTNQPEQFSHLTSNVVKDIVPDRGPLAGILSGLLVSVYEHCFVLPCDMPLMDDSLILTMAKRRQNVDMLLYQHDNVVEPLVGVYSRRCAMSLEQAVFRHDACTENLTDGLKIEIFTPPRRERDSLFPPHFDVDSAGDYGRLVARR